MEIINYKEDFISVYQDVYPAGFCEHLINEFERLSADGAGSNRMQSENATSDVKDDLQITLNLKSNVITNFEDVRPVIKMFFTGIQRCYDQYAETYPMLKHNVIRTTDMKMQKTSPGGGYHIWHCEQNNAQPHRVVVFMLYLNTLNVEDGGETEFLHQRKRITPQENTVVLWPASFTHPHRGNTVLGDKDKYIITGWFSLE